MTVSGYHTPHELDDWLKAKNFEYGKVSAAFAGGADSWSSKDPSSYQSWAADYNAFAAKYVPLASKVESFLAPIRKDKGDYDSDLLSLSATLHLFHLKEADSYWNQFQSVLANGGEANHVNPGSWADLVQRFAAAVKKGYIPKSALPPNWDGPDPQPTAPDTDLNALNASGQALKDIQKGLSIAGSTGEKVAIALAALALLILAAKR